MTYREQHDNSWISKRAAPKTEISVVEIIAERLALMKTIREPAREIPVVSEAEVLVMGGGPAGIAAAVAAARSGARVLLLERYGHLGGMATGGLVMFLDRFNDGEEQAIAGIAQEMVERLRDLDRVVHPPTEDWGKSGPEIWDRWARWGFAGFNPDAPGQITYSVAFDPEAFQQVCAHTLKEAGVGLRLHSWAVSVIKTGKRTEGIITESKEGRQAFLGQVLIDATGDGDIFAAAGAPHKSHRTRATLVHRIGNVDVARATRHERENPEDARQLRTHFSRIVGSKEGWLKTVRDDVVWLNCPTFRGIDALSVEDLTRVELAARSTIFQALEFLRGNVPGFESSYLLETAPQIGIRRCRVLTGEYVVTPRDTRARRQPDVVARAHRYFLPYRSLLPKGVDGLLVAGRCHSASTGVLEYSRLIPACMATGQAAGTAAALAVRGGIEPRGVDIRLLQQELTNRGVIL